AQAGTFLACIAHHRDRISDPYMNNIYTKSKISGGAAFLIIYSEGLKIAQKVEKYHKKASALHTLQSVDIDL
ncbi:MAG TPA: hypothetical protein VN372_08660, partial [Methanospirillum sp.]|nr:hypothetical protein [Methanospirillum sp.]